jgi:hypothetical protein
MGLKHIAQELHVELVVLDDQYPLGRGLLEVAALHGQYSRELPGKRTRAGMRQAERTPGLGAKNG